MSTGSRTNDNSYHLLYSLLTTTSIETEREVMITINIITNIVSRVINKGSYSRSTKKSFLVIVIQYLRAKVFPPCYLHDLLADNWSLPFHEVVESRIFNKKFYHIFDHYIITCILHNINIKVVVFKYCYITFAKHTILPVIELCYLSI